MIGVRGFVTLLVKQLSPGGHGSNALECTASEFPMTPPVPPVPPRPGFLTVSVGSPKTEPALAAAADIATSAMMQRIFANLIDKPPRIEAASAALAPKNSKIECMQLISQSRNPDTM